MDQNRIDIIKDFILYCKDNLDIVNLPKIEYTLDRNWASQNRTFGHYLPQDRSLIIYVGNRNLADILRTVSHELVHHRQNELGLLNSLSGQTGSEIENQANSIAGIIMRSYGKKNEVIYETKLVNILDEITASSYRIYVDMDGVLCDFEGQFDHYFGIPVSQYRDEKGPIILQKAIDSIGVNFWAKMPWMPGGKELWNYLSNYNPAILSSPSNFKYAEQGKKIWIKNNLNPQPSKVYFEQSKSKQNVLMGLDNSEIKKSILIDDFYTNIVPWKETGAIGILHKSVENTISILKKFRL